MSMNIWCRCVLSGRNGDEPFSIRVDITRSVSNTGTDNTASVNGTSPTLGSTKAATREPDCRMAITKTDMTVPMTNVPPSPMNIFEVLPKTLCRKKGIKAPTETTARIVIASSPARWKSMPKMVQAMMQ